MVIADNLSYIVTTVFDHPYEWQREWIVIGMVSFSFQIYADFFQFKKRMDWIGVPVSCAVIVLVTFTLFVEGGAKGNPLAAFAFFAIWVGMSLIAIRAENRKRFISPLRNLEQVLDDLKAPKR